MVCTGHCTGQVPPVFTIGISRSPEGIMAFRLNMLAVQLKYPVVVYSVFKAQTKSNLFLHI